MKLLTMQLSPASCYFLPLRSKHSQYPILQHPQSVFLPRVRGQDSQPYQKHTKPYGKVFHVLNEVSHHKYISCT